MNDKDSTSAHVLDRDIIERAQRGEREAVSQLFGDHLGTVHRFALRMCRDEDRARDIAQESLLTALKSLESFRGDASLPGGMGDVSVLDDDRLVADSWSTDGMVVVDLSNLEVTKLSSASGYSISGATLYDDVFFIADSGDDRVMSLDLATGHPEPLVLDERVDRFDVFSSVGMGMVVHPTVTGRMTLFPLATPYREYAFVVDGVWISGFLDGKEVTQ